MTEDDALDELDEIHIILSEVKFPKDVAKRLLNLMDKYRSETDWSDNSEIRFVANDLWDGLRKAASNSADVEYHPLEEDDERYR